MGIDENKAALQRIFDEVVNGRRLELTDELYAEDHVLHPESPDVGPGAAGMRNAFAGLFEEIPDVRVEVHAMVAEGDMVAVRLTFAGTHAASGEPTRWPEVVFTRFADGKAAESWEVIDTGRSPDAPPW